ncbi:hypothetical protein PFISCL1PPCAC_482, partial [Pristionchus fissidentatus]
RMSSAKRSDVVAVVKDTERTPRFAAEPAKNAASAGARGLKDCTNVTGLGGVRKRSAGAVLENGSLRRAKPAALHTNIRNFFYESKVYLADETRKDQREDGEELKLIETGKEDTIDDAFLNTSADDMEPSGSVEVNGEGGKKEEQTYTRMFTGQNEHANRTFRRTQSQFDDCTASRKRPSVDGTEHASDEGTERKRSCAIVLDDYSTVMVEPDGEEEDDVFEASSPGEVQAHRDERDGSPMSEAAGQVTVHHRANFERTLSASVLERGEYAPPLRDDPPLPAVPNVEYELPTLPRKKCQVDSVAFGCILAETLVTEMERLGEVEFRRKYVLIDCRYPYEYHGGHIKHAINLHDNAELPPLFFPAEEEDEEKEKVEEIAGVEEKENEGVEEREHQEVDGREKEVELKKEEEEQSVVPPPHLRIPIFYCEYSQKRGPGMAHALRSFDRRRNMDRYPEVNFDVMYLLECGYRNFFQEFNKSKAELFSVHCNYVEMKKEMKELGKFRAHRKRGRAHKVQQEEGASVMSPTTPGVPDKAKRRAAIAANEKMKEFRTGAAKGAIRLNLTDSEDEKSPVKKGPKQAGL